MTRCASRSMKSLSCSLTARRVRCPCGCSPGISDSDWTKLEDPTKPTGGLHIPSSQCVSDIVQLLGIIERKIGRLPFVGIDEFDFDFCDILSFMNEFLMPSLPHRLLLMKSLVRLSGSGLYAVTKTAGEVAPLGIPQTTWIGLPFESFCKTRTQGPFGYSGYSSTTVPLETLGMISRTNMASSANSSYP